MATMRGFLWFSDIRSTLLYVVACNYCFKTPNFQCLDNTLLSGKRKPGQVGGRWMLATLLQLMIGWAINNRWHLLRRVSPKEVSCLMVTSIVMKSDLGAVLINFTIIIDFAVWFITYNLHLIYLLQEETSTSTFIWRGVLETPCFCQFGQTVVPDKILRMF